jgi:hypothetical protein
MDVFGSTFFACYQIPAEPGTVIHVCLGWTVIRCRVNRYSSHRVTLFSAVTGHPPSEMNCYRWHTCVMACSTRRLGAVNVTQLCQTKVKFIHYTPDIPCDLITFTLLLPFLNQTDCAYRLYELPSFFFYVSLLIDHASAALLCETSLAILCS